MLKYATEKAFTTETGQNDARHVVWWLQQTIWPSNYPKLIDYSCQFENMMSMIRNTWLYVFVHTRKW